MLVLPRFAPRSPGTPCIVAIEGPNGAGKTTLCAALADSLQVPSCLGIDPAWFSPEFKTRMIRDADWFASAMFFLSGCFEQMRGLRASKEPLLIMDRSLWSTLAVHAAESTAGLDTLLSMLVLSPRRSVCPISPLFWKRRWEPAKAGAVGRRAARAYWMH